ncbi:MAG TPA: glucoamylase family protein [Candidatus Solibacter sp.]
MTLITRRTLLTMPAAALALHAAAPSKLSKEDDLFLDDLQRRTFQYFWDFTDPETGMTAGRARADGVPYDPNRRYIGSIAVTGFGLAALCIAAERGWVKPDEARTRVRNGLRFFAEHAPQEHGWFFHWMNIQEGRRTGVLENSEKKSELSSIDTALLMGGILTARGYFQKDAEIQKLATQIYERMDFQWMLNGDPLLLSHGWTPETGFLTARWAKYSEFSIIYLLGIGSPTHAINPESWYAWERPENVYGDYKYVGLSPLFTHQYSHVFVDYRGKREKRGTKIDWFENSVTATRAHRQFCIDLGKEFPGYNEKIWGITSSNSAKGYKAWGGPPSKANPDGTVVPCAAGGSLMLAPEICVPALKAMKQQFGDKIYGRYGFTDAFHPTNGWASADVLGLDTGITLLSAENLRSGNLWKWFMRNPEIPKAMKLAGMSL